jgi:hypothetical protein
MAMQNMFLSIIYDPSRSFYGFRDITEGLNLTHFHAYSPTLPGGKLLFLNILQIKYCSMIHLEAFPFKFTRTLNSCCAMLALRKTQKYLAHGVLAIV